MENQVINKNLGIDLKAYQKLEEALTAGEKRFHELNPEPSRPDEEQEYKRPSLINVGPSHANGALWVVVQQDRTQPVIRLNHKNLTGSDTLEYKELEALIDELQHTKSNYTIAKAYAEARQTFDTQHRQWRQALSDCMGEIRSAWRKAHPDEDDEDEDEDD